MLRASDSVLITQDLTDSGRKQTLLGQVTDGLSQLLGCSLVECLGHAHLGNA